jgi:outer membrane protein assembly factor BamB
VPFLEGLRGRVDCRVDDFRGVGFYVLLQDGETFYLLASREGRLKLRTARGFEPLANREIPGVVELPVETTSAQKELFSQDLRDFLALYKIDSALLDASGGGLDLAMGGRGDDMDTLLDALDQPGVIEAGVAEKTIPLNLISEKMLYVRFDGLVRMRDLYAESMARNRPRRGGRRLGTYVFSAVSALAVISLTAMWASEKLSGRDSGTDRPSADVVVGEPVSTGGGADAEAPGVSVEPPGPAAEEPAGEGQTPVRLSLLWGKTYQKPVTSTPIVAGNRVVFGGRDGFLHALDVDEGRSQWRYRSGGGIGASPRVAGNRVISADYNGNVFAVELRDGTRLWNRKLPEKVVSSPCLGEGEVLVGCYDGKAYALSVETGRVLWKLGTRGRIRGSAAYGGGRYFVPSYDGYFYAVSAGTGAVAWRARLTGPISSSPATDGIVVLIGDPNGSVVAMNAQTGAETWKFQTGGAVKSFLSMDGGKVFAGSSDRQLYCLDAKSGRMLWKFGTGGELFGRPAVAGGNVIFPSYDGYVYCVDADTGTEVDRFETNGPVYSSPALAGEKVFFGNNKGKFYCLSLRGKDAS